MAQDCGLFVLFCHFRQMFFVPIFATYDIREHSMKKGVGVFVQYHY